MARLVAASLVRVREMIRRFSESGMASLDPDWAGGRPRRITTDDETFVVETARTCPAKLGQPFTRWSVRKLSACLADNPTRVVVIGPERLRLLLGRAGVTFGWAKTCKESNDPQRDAKGDRVERVIDEHPQRVFAFEGFGPLLVRPVGGSCWAPRRSPQRQRASCNKLHGVRQFCGCYSVGDDELWGLVRHCKSAATTKAALRDIRARRPDGEQTYVILGNLSAHKHADTARWARRNRVELCFALTYSSWANPIEAHFGPAGEFVPDNSDDTNHTVLTRAVHACQRWRNANKRSPDLLAALRRERARVRSERGHRYGRPTTPTVS